MRRIRLAIVDDSVFIRKALQRLLEGESRIQIVGSAATGEELMDNIRRWKPDVVTLDLSMPGMGGLPTLDRIMLWKRIPVIILSTHSGKDAPLTIEALHRGAVDFIDKQKYSLVDFEALHGILVEKILQVTTPKECPARLPAAPPETIEVSESVEGAARREYEAVFIGASTGGPPAIQEILRDLGPGLPVPVAVVQHMPEGFVRAFAERLNAHLPMAVQEAAHGEPLLPGTAYIAPSGYHLQVRREHGNLVAILTRYPENTPHRPSVDVLFRSAAAACGSRSVGVLLTGMGRDGSEGMAEMAGAGAFTLAQDEASCVVYGMPKAAVELGAVSEELPLEAIGRRVRDMVRPPEAAVTRKGALVSG